MGEIRFRVADDMKDSGIGWLGSIPREWDKNKIGYIFRCFGGGTPDTNVLAYWNGDIPWVSSKDMKRFTLEDSEDHITIAGLRHSSASMVPTNAVLVVMRSGILRNQIPVAITSRRMAINQDLKAFIPVKNILPQFLARYIQGNTSNLLLEWRKQGATVESLDFETVMKTHLYCPSSTEQRQIANFLDIKTAQFDSIIAKKEQLIAKLEEAQRSLISELVTGKVKIVDGRLMPRQQKEMMDSGVEGIGSIPLHWTTQELKYAVLGISNGTTQEQMDEGTCLVTRIETISKGKIDLEKTGRLRQTRDLRKYKLNEGDILFSHINSLRMVGNIAFTDCKSDLYHGMNLLRIQAREEPKWLYHFMLSKYFRNTCEKIANPAINQASISTTNLGKVKIADLPLSEKRQISEFLENKLIDLDDFVNKETLILNRLKAAKLSLISEAVTGKIDLRDWAIIEQEGVS